MDFTQIAESLTHLLDAYGIVGMIMLTLLILVVKFGNKLIEVLADRTAKGEIKLPSNKRKMRKDSIFKVNRLLTELM
jgi:hypothetical protein